LEEVKMNCFFTPSKTKNPKEWFLNFWIFQNLQRGNKHNHENWKKILLVLEGAKWLNLWKRKSTLGIFQPNLKISSPTFSTKLFLVEVVVETMAFNQHPWYIDEEAHLFVGTNVVDNGFVESVKTAVKGTIYTVSKSIIEH